MLFKNMDWDPSLYTKEQLKLQNEYWEKIQKENEEIEQEDKIKTLHRREENKYNETEAKDKALIDAFKIKIKVKDITKEYILKTSINSYNTEIKLKGIYFLIKKNEIIYVGQSNHIFRRIEQHKKTKDFNYFTFFTSDNVSSALLNKIETYLILKFRPSLNKTVSSYMDKWLSFRTIRELAKEQNIRIYALRKKLIDANIIPNFANRFEKEQILQFLSIFSTAQKSI